MKRKPAKSLFKRISAWLHLWLGLISGIIVFIVSVTGCLFCFQEEISNITHKNTFFIQPQKTQVLPLSILNEKAQAALGKDEPINFITAYKDSTMAWEFMAYKTNDTALTYFGAVSYFRSAFINPYSGAVTGIFDYKYNFFNVIKYLHWSLLLNDKIGQPIVGYGTLIFVILLVTGLVLWWPKKWNKANKKQAFTIRFKSRFKRLNYDLHNVFGFYSLLLALILGLTGMVFSFQWFSNLVYATANASLVQPVYKQVESTPTKNFVSYKPIDVAFNNAVKELPTANRIGVTPASDKTGVIYMYGYNKEGVYYNSDELRFDQYSGKLLYRRNDTEKNRGEKLIEMNYDIHVGAIGGIAGKIIAFIISFICASLPVTGFLVWWNKGRKSLHKKIP